MSYANGRYPLSMFIHRGGNIYLSPSMNARWNEAVRLATEKYGVRLYITGDIDGLGGWNGYRPYDAQVAYKRHYGNKAAAAGYSSHGGKYQGREVFAADVANWADLAPGNSALAWSRFVAIMRTVGLTVDFVQPREQWHVGDFNNPWTVPTFGAVTINPGTTNRPQSEEDDNMLMLKITGVARTHYVALGEGGTFRHFIQTDPYQRIMLLSRSADDWQEIHITELPAFLRTYGCDLSIWDFRDSADYTKSLPGTDPRAVFAVLDPLTGKVAPGNVWSATNASRRATDDLIAALDALRHEIAAA